MTTQKPTPAQYTPPAYVSAFMVTTLLLIVLGVISIFLELGDGHVPLLGIGCLIGAAVNYLYGQIANDIGRTAWQTKRLASDLQIVIDRLARPTFEQAKPGTSIPTTATIAPEVIQESTNQETAKIYCVIINERSRGPFSLQELRELYAKGKISLSQRVSKEDGEEGPTVDELLDI